MQSCEIKVPDTKPGLDDLELDSQFQYNDDGHDERELCGEGMKLWESLETPFYPKFPHQPDKNFNTMGSNWVCGESRVAEKNIQLNMTPGKMTLRDT